MKILGPCTAKVSSRQFRSPSDQKGIVLIEVKDGDVVPEGYGVEIRYIVERDFRPTKVLAKDGKVVEFWFRHKAGDLLKKITG